MSIYNFYQKILKSFKFFGLVIIITFSFYVYGGFNPGQGNLGKKPPKENLTQVEQDKIDELQRHFMSEVPMEHFFVVDENRDVNQSFDKECPNQYGNFKSKLTALNDKKNSRSELAQIENIKKECLSTLDSEYFNLYKFIESKLKVLRTHPVHQTNAQEIINTFKGIQIESDWARELNRFFSNLDTLKTCVSKYLIKGRYGYSDSFKDILIGLKNENCSEAKKEVEKLAKDGNSLRLKGYLQHLVDLPNLCSKKSECVAELEKKVGLPENDPRIIPFESCSEEVQKNSNCCSSLELCEYPSAKQAIQSHRTSVQSLVSSGNENACSPTTNSGLRQTEDDLFQNTQKACSDSADNCWEKCDDELTKFKSAFLRCFLVPDYTVSYHSNNTCKLRIDNIKDKYKQLTINQEKNLSSASNASEISDCFALRDEMRREQLALKDRVRGSVQGWCGEYMAEKQNSQQQQQQQAETAPAEFPHIPIVRFEPSSSDGPERSPSSYKPSQGFEVDDPPANEGYEVENPQSPNSDKPMTTNFGDNNEDGADSDENPNMPPGSSDHKTAQEDEEDSGCLGVCDVPDDQDEAHSYPFLEKHKERMANKEGTSADASQIADKVNEMMKQDREDRERELAGGENRGLTEREASGSFFEDFQEGVSGFFDDVVRTAVQEPLQEAYKAAVGEPEESSPPKLSDLLNVHDARVDLIQMQRKRFYQFCIAHDCGITKGELEQLRIEANR